jgi:hypothetical protein
MYHEWGELDEEEEKNAYMLLVGKSDQGVGQWIILRWVLERMGWGGMDWIGQAKDRDR